MTRPWTESRGAIAAGPAELKKATVINALLIHPIALLPQAEGDPVKPFAIGVWNDIRPLLRPDMSVTSLRRATSAYTHSKRYTFACAQPGAYRHDIDGNAISPVSAEDRMAAQLTFERLRNSLSVAPSPPLQSTATTLEASRSSLIRAGILGRTQQKTA
jgi:ProP effector